MRFGVSKGRLRWRALVEIMSNGNAQRLIVNLSCDLEVPRKLKVHFSRLPILAEGPVDLRDGPSGKKCCLDHDQAFVILL